MLRKLLLVQPVKSDLGSLAVRVGAHVSLFLKHGLEKIYPQFWVEMSTKVSCEQS
jgi:hypothetical protein